MEEIAAKVSDGTSRIGPALTIVVVATVVMTLPHRFHLLPAWASYAILVLVLVPLFLRGLFPRVEVVGQIERVTTLCGSTVITAFVVATLGVLIGSIVAKTQQLDALNLLMSSTALWMTTVLTFSLLYWALDRGGPDARAARLPGYPDFMFAQSGAGDAVPPNWLPQFIDYLFASFTTQTAFGPTDTVPLTTRFKALMMIQSTISLVTLVVVASRAIGILQ